MIARQVHDLATADNVETLWDMAVEYLAGYGVERVFYGATRDLSRDGLGDPDKFLVLTNHSKAYLGTYLTRQYYLDASMVRWSVANTGVCSWAMMHRRAARGEMSAREREVYDFNRENGLDGGYQISFAGMEPRQRAGMGLTSNSGISQAHFDALWDRHGDRILALCQVLHLRIQSLPQPCMVRPLTPRQREVLQWVGDGKTVQDISVLLGRTPATVEKHLRLAREALGAETTAQAVLKASLQNQLYTVSL